jgi:hypothetical protein
MKTRMRIKKIYLLTIVLSIGLLVRGGTFSPADVFWVKATGKASPHIKMKSLARAAALRAAKIHGYKKLAEKAGFSTRYQVGDTSYIKVEAYLKGATVISRRYISDYRVEIVMEIPKHLVTRQLKPVKNKMLRWKIYRTKDRIRSTRQEIGRLKKRLAELHHRLEKLEEQAK